MSAGGSRDGPTRRGRERIGVSSTPSEMRVCRTDESAGTPDSGWAYAVVGDGQVDRAAQHRALPIRWRVGDQAWVVQAFGELGQCDLRLQAGQWCSEAVVDAAGKGQVHVAGPV